MSASLLEALQGLVTPALLKTASSTLGESEGALTSGLGAIVSKILSALVSGAGDQSLMGTVAGLVTTQARDPGALADVAGLLSSGSSAVAGNQLIGSLFGVKEGGIAQAAAATAGLKAQSGASLMALAGPLVLAGLSKSSGDANLTGAGLASLLNTQRASLLGSLTTATGAAAATAAAASGVAAVTQAAATVAAAPVAAATAAASAAQTAVKQAAPAVAAQASAAASTATTAASTAAKTAATATAESSGAGIGWLIWPLLLMALAGVGYFLWETKYSELKSSPPPAMEKKAEVKVEKKAEAPAAAPAAAPEPAPAVAADAGNGMVDLTLLGGGKINAAANGVEGKLINFLQDANSVIDKKTWFDFDRLNFETGSTNLTPESKFQVSNVAAIMKAFSTAAIKIGGYTDNVGNPEDNLKLSDERAKAVMAAIVALGVAPERVEAEGYGEQYPLEANDTADGRTKNRRTALSVRAR